MRIVSTSKDYYDYISHTLGADPNVLYARGKTSEPHVRCFYVSCAHDVVVPKSVAGSLLLAFQSMTQRNVVGRKQKICSIKIKLSGRATKANCAIHFQVRNI